MDRLALFRSNAFEADHVLRGLSIVGNVVDVHDRRDLRLERVTLDGAAIIVRGRPSSDFCHALFLGPPSPSPFEAAGRPLELAEQEFEAEEWAMALRSALLVSGIGLLQRGLVSGAAAPLMTKPGQAALLASLGWKTPPLSLTRTSAGEETRSYGCDMGSMHRFFLCVTRRHELMLPASASSLGFSTREVEALRKTRQMMKSLELDWLTISMAACGGRILAFGACSELPLELGDGGTAAILASCIDAPGCSSAGAEARALPAPEDQALSNGRPVTCS